MRSRMANQKGFWQHHLYPMLLALADYIAIVAAQYGAIAFRNLFDVYARGAYSVPWQAIYIYVPILFILLLYTKRTYLLMVSVFDLVRRIFYGILYGLGVALVVLYFLQYSVEVSRQFFLCFGVLALLFVYLGRYAVMKTCKMRHLFFEPILLVGAGRTAERLMRVYHGDLGYRYDVVGLLDDNPISESLAGQLRHLGPLSRTERFVRLTRIKTVLIAAPGMDKARLVAITGAIQPYVSRILFVPNLIGMPIGNVRFEVLFNEKLLLMEVGNNLAHRGNRILKRTFDLVATIAGGLVLLPFLLVLAAIIAIDNRGRVIFAHRRVGRNGEMFPCYKFQTMVPDADVRLKEYLAENPAARAEWEATFKLTDDPRVTKLGAFLRKTSLDELPQLVNVLKGEMSLVGPRPIVQAEVPRYGERIREYYMVRPGITGMWQVSGRSDTTYDERVEMDTWYVRNWSVWADLVFLFKTFRVVADQQGAY